MQSDSRQKGAIYKVEVFVECAPGFDTGRAAMENMIDLILKEALPEAFLVRDVAVEEQ